MDIDRFIATNQPLWDRLAALSQRSRSGLGSMRAAEIDEMIRLYQRTSSHLSYARTYYRDPALVARLTGIVATASSIVYGTRPRSYKAIGRFFTVTFPAALWHSRRFMAASAVLLLAPAIAVAAWLATSPEAVDAIGPPALRQAYLEEDFEAYYSSRPASEFAAQVTTNNIQVGFLAFASGVALCVPTALLLVFNGGNVGVAAGLFTAAGQSSKFYGLILPHGLLELTAVVVAGGAGLALGWALIDPGDRTRRVALAEEGRRAVVLVLGLVLTFAVAGAIEGFITGSPLPTVVRVGVGVLVEVAFVGYAIVFGRQAAAQGLTGRFGEDRPSALTTALSPSP